MNAATALAVLPERPQGRALTAVDVREHVNLIQEVMRSVMKEDTHYGIIPGCDKPSLYKAGSEVLLATFRIAVKPVVEDLSTADSIRYRVRAVGIHQQTDICVGEGIGECSSDEAKYKWRRCYDQREFNATPESRRRIKYSTARNGKEYENMEVRTEPADLANTVLKMAKKRAQIDLTLTATAASDIFTQDVEDLPEELRPAAPAGGQPMSGVWEAMDKDQKSALMKIALSVGDYIDSGDVPAAVAHIESQGLDTDEKAALWSQLDSGNRTALKKAAQASKDQAGDSP